ncbi:MAG TPA: TRAP transporter small permease [Rhodocyclaceae bacterium]|nr:TRAP transporter small permease [Rhodocyclaceae bacterium]
MTEGGGRLAAANPSAPPGSILALLERGAAALHRLILLLAMVALLLAAAVLTYSVFTRYFLKSATDWQDEAAVFLLVGASFLTGAYVQSVRGHVGIEALTGLLPEAIDRLRHLLVDLAACGFCLFFAWKSWALFHEAWSEGQTTSSSWGPPLWIPYSTMAAGMSLLGLQMLLQSAIRIASFRRP